MWRLDQEMPYIIGSEGRSALSNKCTRFSQSNQWRRSLGRARPSQEASHLSKLILNGSNILTSIIWSTCWGHNYDVKRVLVDTDNLIEVMYYDLFNNLNYLDWFEVGLSFVSRVQHSVSLALGNYNPQSASWFWIVGSRVHCCWYLLPL